MILLSYLCIKFKNFKNKNIVSKDENHILPQKQDINLPYFELYFATSDKKDKKIRM